MIGIAIVAKVPDDLDIRGAHRAQAVRAGQRIILSRLAVVARAGDQIELVPVTPSVARALKASGEEAVKQTRPENSVARHGLPVPSRVDDRGDSYSCRRASVTSV